MDVSSFPTLALCLPRLTRSQPAYNERRRVETGLLQLCSGFRRRSTAAAFHPPSNVLYIYDTKDKILIPGSIKKGLHKNIKNYFLIWFFVKLEKSETGWKNLSTKPPNEKSPQWRQSLGHQATPLVSTAYDRGDMFISCTKKNIDHHRIWTVLRILAALIHSSHWCERAEEQPHAWW